MLLNRQLRRKLMRGVGVTLVALTPLCVMSCVNGREGESEEICTLHFGPIESVRSISLSPVTARSRGGIPSGVLSRGDSVYRLPADTLTLYSLSAGGAKAYFIAEAGDLSLDVENLEIVGEKLNGRKRQFEITLSDMRRRAAARYDAVAKSSNLPPDDLRAELGLLVVRENRNIVRYVMSVVCANRGNALGKYAFWVGVAQNRAIDSEEYKKLLVEAGKMVAEFEPIRAVTRRMERSAATSAGCPVADVLLIDTSGDSTSITECADGDLTIIHVFDPYDERTPQTMQQLKRIASKYGPGRTPTTTPMRLVSVAEYAKEDIVNRIASHFGTSWTMLADPEANFSEVYGIDVLPFFLIVENGIILERGVGGEALPLWVSAYVNESSDR